LSPLLSKADPSNAAHWVRTGADWDDGPVSCHATALFGVPGHAPLLGVRGHGRRRDARRLEHLPHMPWAHAVCAVPPGANSGQRRHLSGLSRCSAQRSGPVPELRRVAASSPGGVERRLPALRNRVEAPLPLSPAATPRSRAGAYQGTAGPAVPTARRDASAHRHRRRGRPDRAHQDRLRLQHRTGCFRAPCGDGGMSWWVLSHHPKHCAEGRLGSRGAGGDGLRVHAGAATPATTRCRSRRTSTDRAHAAAGTALA
jgi:hypothetical protein